MAIFGCKFGNVVVTSNGEEIEATVPYCGSSCLHYNKNTYKNQSKCKYGLEHHVDEYNCCKLFTPIGDHIWWNHQWWS